MRVTKGTFYNTSKFFSNPLYHLEINSNFSMTSWISTFILFTLFAIVSDNILIHILLLTLKYNRGLDKLCKLRESSNSFKILHHGEGLSYLSILTIL